MRTRSTYRPMLLGSTVSTVPAAPTVQQPSMLEEIMKFVPAVLIGWGAWHLLSKGKF